MSALAHKSSRLVLGSHNLYELAKTFASPSPQAAKRGAELFTTIKTFLDQNIAVGAENMEILGLEAEALAQNRSSINPFIQGAAYDTVVDEVRKLVAQDAIQRTFAALQRMESSDQEITFRTVATEARVSTAWLYSRHELRGRIMGLRKSQSHVASAASALHCRERISRQNIVAPLRLRIKRLEEKNRELTELLEHAYGVIARTRVDNAT